MKIRLITVLIVVLVLLAAWFVPQFIANAKTDKPPVPHHNIPGKSVPANCHSRHARDAGMDCDSGTQEIEEQGVPNSSESQLPHESTEPKTMSVTTELAQVRGLVWGCGGRHSVHVMM